ncbi:hypothetical protein [Flavilitoribacter nigricans]|uniref:Uncharacterized protein n=1 Tax=Flavilitoribacter nigricans (strain ATCC 23147 / DSM 23189 / NBRC 102662 / NCIMB 1420 / SS-2) TaxID=1122177 RepID=A0A2D0NCS8_FLAN2|nr:hypothetical protein [Flavilitoribacter nigricans]PHN06180.1 hypothetical protein CRP01_11390 [Flavilitoribacter nigricans DSM 23189 = NBRC 102662]
MKKQTARTVLVALVVLASLVSYIYLNTVELNTSSEKATQYQLMENEEQLDEETVTNTKLYLPEVALIKKVIETGKSLIPGS